MRRIYSKPFWLIARYRTGGIEALKLPLATGGEALPVFSFEDEARMFLELGTFDGDWRPRETGPGELISVLYCLCAGADKIVLDPLPVPFAGSNDLPSMGRAAFMDFASERAYAAPPALISTPDLTGHRPPDGPDTKNGKGCKYSQCVPDSRLSDATTHMATPERR